MKFIFLLLFMPIAGFASVDVAFIELRSYDGQVIRFEPNGQFAHIAISYRRNWLHSHPVRGVEVISRRDLERMGAIKAIITIPEMAELEQAQVVKFQGKPYDSRFSWSDDEIYCSELVAKLLRMAPLPMTFASEFWPDHFRALRGQPGLSPDDIYRFLRTNGY